jgi:hypothetical protein
MIWDTGGQLWNDETYWDFEEPPAPAPEVVKQNRGKGKKQQIHTQGPWAYR